MTGTHDTHEESVAAAAVVAAASSAERDNQAVGDDTMGIQSQRTKSHTKTNTKKPPHQLAIKSRRGQLTLHGKRAFDQLRDCKICKVMAAGRKPPHRKHHKQCPRLRINVQARNRSIKESRWWADNIKANNRPFTGNERLSGRNMTSENVRRFFQPTSSRAATTNNTVSPESSQETQIPANDTPCNGNETDGWEDMSVDDTSRVNRALQAALDRIGPQSADDGYEFPTIQKSFTDTMNNKKFQKAMDASESKRTKAPLAVHALAYFVSNSVIPKLSNGCAAGTELALQQKAWLDLHVPPGSMTITFPRSCGVDNPPNPLLTLLEDQQLLIVCWELFFQGLVLHCPLCDTGKLVSPRNDYSKHRKLFPIFSLDGQIKWCIVHKYKCNCCKATVDGNDGRLLRTLPAFARQAYPVVPKFAQPNTKWHLDKEASQLFETMMGTYGNGDMFSKNILYRAMIQCHHSKRLVYYSLCSAYRARHGSERPSKPFPELHGEFITKYPPSGQNLRDLHQVILNTDLTITGTSDHERSRREIQSVSTTSIVVQDHTCEVTKNYRDLRSMGNTKFCWTCATETGEIAAAVMVPSSSVIHISHAAMSLRRRPGFVPKIMYSDTWPAKEDYWKLVFGKQLVGRLGLFHFMQRMIRTLRQSHTDYKKAVADYCACIYAWEEKTYGALLQALQDGCFPGGPKSAEETHELQMTKSFKDRYQKFLQKRIHCPATIRYNMQIWWDRYKNTSSDPLNRPAGGREDPDSGKNLFTMQTKSVYEESLKKCEYLQDTLPLDEMYREELPTERQAKNHNLSTYHCKRGESLLEGFHDALANFANLGMGTELADSLHHVGMARHNVERRWKLTPAAENMPRYFAAVPESYDHSYLDLVNALAKQAGCPSPVYNNVRPLPPDNGERFFSEYWPMEKMRKQTFLPSCLNDLCHCFSCAIPPPNASEEDIVTTDANNTERNDPEKRNVAEPSSRRIQDMREETLLLPFPKPQENYMQPIVPAPSLPGQTRPPLGAVPLLPALPPNLHLAFLGASNMPHTYFNDMYHPDIIANYVPTRPRVQTNNCGCAKFNAWLLKPKRNGRPPHDSNCPKRNSKNN